MSYQAGDTLYRLSAGYFIYLPKGVPHAFRVTGTSPVRFLGFTVPGGLMDLYDEVGMPATERRLPGRDGPPVEEEIRRWNEVSPATGYALSGHQFSARPDGSEADGTSRKAVGLHQRGTIQWWTTRASSHERG